jgi:hypothetical protein
MHPDRFGLALGPPFAAGVLEVPDQLLLLGIDADHRLTGGQRRLGDRVDVLKLRVTVGVPGALAGLDVGLQAVAQQPQQLGDRREMHAVALLAQRRGEMPHAPRRPDQQRLRIAAAASFDQPLEILQQRRVDIGQRVASASTPTHAARLQTLARLKLGDPLTDRRHRDPRRSRRRSNPAAASRARLTGRPQPPLTLIELARQRPELHADRDLINHAPSFDTENPTPATLFIYGSYPDTSEIPERSAANVHGVSYSFDAADAPTQKQTQYYEMFGSRGIWHEGWKAVTVHGPGNGKGNFDDDAWQLFHTDEDRSEAHDLADRHPEKLDQLKAIWMEEAKANNVLQRIDTPASAFCFAPL